MYDHGLIVGKFWPFHLGHSHLIKTACKQCKRVTVGILAHPDQDIPLEVRQAWISEIHPDVHLVAEIDPVPPGVDGTNAWDRHLEIIRGMLDAPVDAVFTSDAYGEGLAERLKADWVQVDPDRSTFPVSGTEIRKAPYENWHFLPPPVRAWYVRRVVVTGAESTGTTTLALSLADTLNCPFVPEYGRTYTLERAPVSDAPWKLEELEHIARTQIEMENDAARKSQNGWLVADTDALTTALWQERYFGERSEGMADILNTQVQPFAYFLSADDIPFIPDRIREGGPERGIMQARFRELLSQGAAPFLEVKGRNVDRVVQAMDFLDALSPDDLST